MANREILKAITNTEVRQPTEIWFEVKSTYWSKKGDVIPIYFCTLTTCIEEAQAVVIKLAGDLKKEYGPGIPTFPQIKPAHKANGKNGNSA